MLIDNIENKNIDKRCVRKEFKCQSCFRFFKKLVQILIEHIQCPFCYSDNCKVITNSNDNDSIGSDNSSLKTDEEEEKEDKIKNKSENNNNNINEKKKKLFIFE